MDLLVELQLLGFTYQESFLYLQLLRLKSATVSEVHKIEGYSQKKRPNLYKLLHSMIEKSLVYSEVKDGRTLYFPNRPHIVLQSLIGAKRNELKCLEEVLPNIESRLEEIHSTETISLNNLDNDIHEFIDSIKPAKWLIRERPLVSKLGGSGKQVSIEFNTRKRFSGDSAGIILFVFRYQEHISHFIKDVRTIMKNGMVEALEGQRGHGRFNVKHYEFSVRKGQLPPLNKDFEYIVVSVYLNFMNLRAEGGLLHLLLRVYPNWIVGVWAASLDDLSLLLGSILERYEVA